MKNGFTVAPVVETTLANAKVGDVVRFDGMNWRVTKKAGRNIAVEPYRWYHAVEDWILDKLGQHLP